MLTNIGKTNASIQGEPKFSKEEMALLSQFQIAASAAHCRTRTYHYGHNGAAGIEEWLEAFYIIDKGWQIKRAFNTVKEGDSESVGYQMVKEAPDNMSFFDVIKFLSLYEASQNGLGFEAKKGEKIKSMTPVYFRHMAEAEALAFDDNGMPRPTDHGYIISEDVSFPPDAQDKALDAFSQKIQILVPAFPVFDFSALCFDNSQGTETILKHARHTAAQKEEVKRLERQYNNLQLAVYGMEKAIGEMDSVLKKAKKAPIQQYTPGFIDQIYYGDHKVNPLDKPTSGDTGTLLTGLRGKFKRGLHDASLSLLSNQTDVLAMLKEAYTIMEFLSYYYFAHKVIKGIEHNIDDPICTETTFVNLLDKARTNLKEMGYKRQPIKQILDNVAHVDFDRDIAPKTEQISAWFISFRDAVDATAKKKQREVKLLLDTLDTAKPKPPTR